MKLSTSSSVRRRVVAGVVAIAAVAGIGAMTAPAALSAGGPNSGTVATGPDAAPDVAKRDRWAVIAADGTFSDGKGVVSSTALGGGAYEVIFNKNVRNCAYVATIGEFEDSGTESPGFITTAARFSDINGVFVATTDTAGTGADRSFHLYVAC